MNIPETSALLAMVAANDRRTVGDIDVEVWHDALDDMPFEDCRAVVRAHVRQSLSSWLSPSDIRAGVKRIRADRVARAVEMPPDADPDDVAAYLEALRDGRCRTASGDRAMDRRALTATFRDVPKASQAAIEAARQPLPPEPVTS
ncbi:hypothetical protein [Nocardioides sp.]|uniref:hypothetical protein n=1 Tax=Nocardioides sp. TaxID=35761 RepID=UPI002C4870CA|nr:hypothetical protein [Nocardioides sp.]HXH77145.1 hypothetical protein [Nocardioides sp.]